MKIDSSKFMVIAIMVIAILAISSCFLATPVHNLPPIHTQASYTVKGMYGKSLSLRSPAQIGLAERVC